MDKHPSPSGGLTPAAKKAYRTPRLVEYGDLRKITKVAKSSNRSDAPTPPSTKK